MKIMNTAQYLIEAFLVMPCSWGGYKRPRKIDGEQMEIKFSWFAKVWIDMKEAMKEGSCTLWFVNKNRGDQLFMTMEEKRKAAQEPRGCMYWAMKKYREGMELFRKTGEVRSIPSFVYFL